MRAIDIHCHPSTEQHTRAMAKYFPALEKLLGRKLEPKSEDEMANDFRRDDALAMMIAWDAETATGGPTIPNDYVSGLSEKYPDVFLPGWAVVDPWKGDAALAEIERSITTLGLKGVKWMPIIQAFSPDDPQHFPFWDLCQSLGAPVLIHSGTTAIGSGMPGGAGAHLKYSRPIPCIDDVAAEFPDLTIIMAHPAYPWTEEAIAVLLHKANVYMDISGWRPRYIPDSLKREMGRRLQDKILFGSDYPGWSTAQCLDELEMEGLKPEVIEKLFKDNAIRILDLADAVTAAERSSP